jgi:hypothetical protein
VIAAASVRAAALEIRDVVQAAQGELEPKSVGPVVVSGMLAEQLARELAAGAEPGAVIVGDGSPVGGAEVLVHVIAGAPSDADQALVTTADRDGVPVLLVQLWPQAEWQEPFVLSPFVVECRAGEGFPVGKIAHRIVEASEHAASLASRIPVLEEAVAGGLVRGATVRAALLAVAGARKEAARPLIVLEQVRMLSRLRSLEAGSTEAHTRSTLAGEAAVILAAGFAFRAAARAARRALPEPVGDAAVAAAGTWALGAALRRLGSVRSGS